MTHLGLTTHLFMAVQMVQFWCGVVNGLMQSANKASRATCSPGALRASSSWQAANNHHTVAVSEKLNSFRPGAGPGSKRCSATTRSHGADHIRSRASSPCEALILNGTTSDHGSTTTKPGDHSPSQTEPIHCATLFHSACQSLARTNAWDT